MNVSLEKPRRRLKAFQFLEGYYVDDGTLMFEAMKGCVYTQEGYFHGNTL
jgi:hypothetical protein